VATCNVFGKFVRLIVFFKGGKHHKKVYVKESILKSNVNRIQTKYVLIFPPKNKKTNKIKKPKQMASMSKIF